MNQLHVTTKIEYYFTGRAMEEARGELSQEQFAEKCGWTQQYQHKIELPGISHHLTDTIAEGLKKAGVTIKTYKL